MDNGLFLPPNMYTAIDGVGSICRLINGTWQLSGWHGEVDRPASLRRMREYYDCGLHTWDTSPHYGLAEDYLGELRTDYGAKDIKIFTQWWTDKEYLTRDNIKSIVYNSLRRLQSDRIHTIFFHFANNSPQQIEYLHYLDEVLRTGDIGYLGVTNIGAAKLTKVLQTGIKISAIQLQYSIIDARPECGTLEICKAAQIPVFAYGVLCGGFLSDHYLNEPPPRVHELNTASLRKYMALIKTWGGWEKFQRLLIFLASIANDNSLTISQLAQLYILSQPGIVGVTIGSRYGMSDRRHENIALFSHSLQPGQMSQIDNLKTNMLDAQTKLGDCGDEYRW